VHHPHWHLSLRHTHTHTHTQAAATPNRSGELKIEQSSYISLA
jgi:hypothetical protein